MDMYFLQEMIELGVGIFFGVWGAILLTVIIVRILPRRYR